VADSRGLELNTPAHEASTVHLGAYYQLKLHAVCDHTETDPRLLHTGKPSIHINRGLLNFNAKKKHKMTTAPSFNNTLYRFFTFDVTPQVFYNTRTSFAFVNIRPLLPGHVLVSPIRPVARLSELTDAEAADLFVAVKRVGRMLERVYNASALTIPLQDGFDAGQSVPHLHVHLLPRQPSDLGHEGGPDAVYDRLEGDDGDIGKSLATRHRPRQPKVDEESIPLRTAEEMAAEADMLRAEMGKDETKSAASVLG